MLPMTVLWVLAAAAVAAYYRLDVVADSLRWFGKVQRDYGRLASFVNRFIFGGALPGVFLLAMPSIRPVKAVSTVLAQAVWCGLIGILVDVFFALQCRWFGAEPKLSTVVAKTLVDQFGFCVLVVTPLNAVFYAWVGDGFRLHFKGWREFLSLMWYSYRGNIVANWLVSIPTMLAVYAFPPELQMTVSGFACAYWALLAIFIGSSLNAESGGTG